VNCFAIGISFGLIKVGIFIVEDALTQFKGLFIVSIDGFVKFSNRSFVCSERRKK